MKEPKSFCVGESTYYPVWIEPDGTEWHHEPVWEGCEYGSDPNRWEEKLRSEADGECSNPVEYMSAKQHVCRVHFEAVNLKSKVHWALF